MKFFKYHALGNDYLVLDPSELNGKLDGASIVKICHRNYGLGSDGILLGPLESKTADFRLRIYNPDASEAEKSGNGLRIFCRYLFDQGKVEEEQTFSVETLGGIVEAVVFEGGKRIRVGMGKAIFVAKDIPVATDNPDEEVIRSSLKINDGSYEINCVSVGNPHCVIPLESVSSELAHQLGPIVENHDMFPNRINMQLLKVLDRNNIQIEIWERGAGYTLASGTSSCAASVIAHKLGFCDNEITVHSPGGKISIEIGDNYQLTMTGPTTRVGEFELSNEAILQELP
ncbi:MAG: diaminopimelate epimerase [Opitutales bacterium]|nr:diaminopimelate epimerase [Opitutales bacterium]